VHAVDEGHVVADDVGHRREEVAGLHHHVDGLVGVAEHRDARVARDRLLPALEGAGLAVGLHRRDDLLRHLLEVGDLVEADDVPDLHHALLAAVHVAEEVGHRGAAGEQRRVRRDLLDDVALARTARPELDQVVVALRERDEAHEEEQLQAPRHLARLVAHAAHDEVEPLVGRELAADAAVLLEVEGGDLDGRELVDPERVLARDSSSYSKRMSTCDQTPPITRRS
jgi:hypothetical protein